MRNRKNGGSSGSTVIILLSLFCAALIAVSLAVPDTTSSIYRVTGFFITPMQKGINTFGSWLGSIRGNLADASALREENEELKAQVDTLTAENSKLVLDKEELARLRELVDLSETYSEYDTVGARVISKDAGNWFSTFTIDRGRADGIKVDCNVLGGSGLVGIVTDVGENWARVRSIIDDDSNVSAMISTTSDTCVVAGNLQLIDTGSLSLVKLTDRDNKVHVGDKVVTSNISEKYLPGILIGYISELGNDSNNLTKSGEITPVADFRHIQEVLVIRDLKEYVASPGGDTSQIINDVEKPENVLGGGAAGAAADAAADAGAEAGAGGEEAE